MKAKSPTLTLYLGAFVAGVSGKLVPSFVKHIEDDAEPSADGPGKGPKGPPPDAWSAVPDAAHPEHHAQSQGGPATSCHERFPPREPLVGSRYESILKDSRKTFLIK